MRDEPWLEELREAVRRDNERSPDEIWDDLVRHGIIDEEGNVLIRMPQPPQAAQSVRKKRTPRKPKKAPEGNGDPR